MRAEVYFMSDLINGRYQFIMVQKYMQNKVGSMPSGGRKRCESPPPTYQMREQKG